MKKKFGNAAKKKSEAKSTGRRTFFFHTKFLNGVFGVLPQNQENVFFFIFFCTPFLANYALLRNDAIIRRSQATSFERPFVSNERKDSFCLNYTFTLPYLMVALPFRWDCPQVV